MAEVEHLYKYFDFEGTYETLKKSEVRLTRPEKFNDPFDAQPFKIFTLSIEDFRAYVLKTAEKVFNNNCDVRKNWGRNFNEDEFRGMLESNTDIEKIYVSLLEQAATLKTAFEECLISSFTEASASLLMWAHYAKSHTGAMLCFRRDSAKIGLLAKARKVKYCTSLPYFASVEEWTRLFDDPRTSTDIRDNILNILTSKSPEWEYEKEWRIFKAPEDIYAHKGFEYGSFPFDPDELVSVSLGMKMKEEDKRKILAICKYKYPNVDVFQAYRSEEKFEILYNKLR